jgi:hypothetical protein
VQGLLQTLVEVLGAWVAARARFFVENGREMAPKKKLVNKIVVLGDPKVADWQLFGKS